MLRHVRHVGSCSTRTGASPTRRGHWMSENGLDLERAAAGRTPATTDGRRSVADGPAGVIGIGRRYGSDDTTTVLQLR